MRDEYLGRTFSELMLGLDDEELGTKWEGKVQRSLSTLNSGYSATLSLQGLHPRIDESSVHLPLQTKPQPCCLAPPTMHTRLIRRHCRSPARIPKARVRESEG